MAQFRNSRETYGLIAIWLHWIVAAAFIVNYVIIYYREWFVDDADTLRRSLFSTHTAIGISILVFVALRVLWRLTNPTPKPVPGTRLEHALAQSVHMLLYLVMIGLPLTGYLGTGAASKFFFLWEIPSFRDTALFSSFIEGQFGLSWEQWEAPIDFLHKTGGTYAVSLLIIAHAAAALMHHFVRRDHTLKRMLAPSLAQGSKTQD